MRTIKKVASHIFIDGFGGMTQGLFATLIIGTMIQQIGLLIGGSTGNVIYLLGKAAAALTSAGIGVGVAVKYGESPLVTVSAAVAAMVGGYAGKITGHILCGRKCRSGRTWRTARRFHRSFRRHHLRPSGFRQDQG